MKPVLYARLRSMHVQFRLEDEDVLFHFTTLLFSPACDLVAVPSLLVLSVLISTDEFPFT
jgi:hypothetical protein